MIRLNNVKREGIGYKIFKILSDRFHDIYFYNKVQYTGIENVDKTMPNLIAPNHQNALMDAMAILASRRKSSPVFLARSDIFSTDFWGNFFISLKILPVYRIRDGKDKLKKNEEIFNLSVEILENHKDLVIFPEAQHTNRRSLLQLKKGLMRVAFHTAEKNDFNLDLQIIPVGIYYEKYTNYRSKLLVNYGKPLSLKNYETRYKENKQATLLSLRNDLRTAMIPLAIHIKNKEYYEIFENCREILDYQVAKKDNLSIKILKDKFIADKKTIAILDDFAEKKTENFETFAQKVKDYSENLSKNKIKDYLFDKPVSVIKNILSTLFLLFLSPIIILSTLNFIIPLGLPELLVKKLKDKQFHSSVRYLVGMFLPFVWGVIGCITLSIFVNWWSGIIFLLMQHPLFAIWLELRKFSKKIFGKWRFIFKKNKLKNLKKQREEILEQFFSIKRVN